MELTRLVPFAAVLAAALASASGPPDLEAAIIAGEDAWFLASRTTAEEMGSYWLDGRPRWDHERPYAAREMLLLRLKEAVEAGAVPAPEDLERARRIREIGDPGWESWYFERRPR